MKPRISRRRFLQATDGIYMFAYHTRLPSANENGYKTWCRIIDDAGLITSPYRWIWRDSSEGPVPTKASR